MPTDLEVAHRLASVAAEVAVPYFHGSNQTWTKHDGSPVGEADLAADHAIRALLKELGPQDGVLSEELPELASASGRRWIIDPVDGTYAFVAGLPDWGTNIALEVDGEIVLGIVTRPLLQRRWWATAGQGAYSARDVDGDLTAPQRLSMSTTAVLAESRLSGWPDDDARGMVARLRDVGTWVEADMTLFTQLMAGQLEAFVGFGGGAWDFAPAVVIVTEAGGTFSDLHGGRSVHKGCGLMTNGAIDSELRRHLGLDA